MPAPLNLQEKERRRLIGNRVRRARLLNGWTLDDLGDHIMTTSKSPTRYRRQALAKVEAGAHSLTPFLVAALETALRLPAGTLSAIDENLAAGTRVVGLAADPKVTEAMRRHAEQAILAAAHERLTESAAALRRSSFRSPFKFTGVPPTLTEIENMADHLREKWGLGDGPIADLTYSMERQSALVLRVEAPHDAIVFSGRVSSYPVMLWLGQLPVSVTEIAGFRIRILHGLIETLALGRGLRPTDAIDRATKLSRAVLLPRVALTDAFGTGCNRITADNILAIASQYVVPISAALERVSEIGIVDEQRAESLRRSLNGKQLDGTHECSRWKNLLPPAFQQRALRDINPTSGICPQTGPQL